MVDLSSCEIQKGNFEWAGMKGMIGLTPSI